MQNKNTITDSLNQLFRASQRPGPKLRYAVRILQRAGEIERLLCDGGGPLDRSLQRYQRSHPQLGKNDRSVLATAVYRFARHRDLIRACAPELTPGSGDYLLLALADACGGSDQFEEMHRLPGGLSPWQDRMTRLHRRREALIRTVERQRNHSPAEAGEDARLALSALFSLPLWWLRHGPWPTLGDAVCELVSLKRPQQLALRVQQHRGVTREAVLDRLHELGMPARPTERSPWGLVVQGRHNVLNTELYRSGAIEVQDEGSQLVAGLCDPEPGARVLDLCAGGGGKALALASSMEGRGEVVAYDVDRQRLRDVTRRARRAGLDNIRVATDPADMVAGGPYDLVLADVPCTSSGTLRRNPDVAWRWNERDLEELTTLQGNLLEQAAEQVRKEGHLIYATCSLLETENHTRVEAFLRNRGDFAPAPPGDRPEHTPFADLPDRERGCFRLPANLERYTGDAFFAARLRS